MNRRRSLLALGAVGATACGYYAWHERRGLTRADFGAEDAGVPGSPAISPAVRAILEYALLAPSGHNTQPWTVRGTDGELRIGTERSHWLPKVDPSNRELALSVGAFLENLLIAAPGLGYAADFTVTGADASDRELLLVRLTGT
ncbi:MAG: hypothetical protein SGI92_29245, partial [Bryobacteraceae bacterium]|nr:hypothetical protein [Bryobacteraceae bacterium]